MVGLLVVSASASMATTTDYIWTGAGADNLWSNPANWNDNSLPDNPIWTEIPSTTNQPLIDSTVNATFGNMLLVGEYYSPATDPATLTMTGGTLGGDRVFLGCGAAGNKGVMNLSGGIVTTNWSDGFIVGYGSSGVLNMTGGTINCFSFHIGRNGSGEAYLNGGTVNASVLKMSTGGVSSHLDITDGKLVLPASQLTTVNGYVANGWITGYGESSKVVVTTVGDNIEVTAVPEPATLGLILIGSFVGYLRKKA